MLRGNAWLVLQVFLNPVIRSLDPSGPFSGSSSGHPMSLCLSPSVLYFCFVTSQVRTLHPAQYCVTCPTPTASSLWAGFVSEGPQCLARCWHPEIRAKVALAGCPLCVLWLDGVVLLEFNLADGKGSRELPCCLKCHCWPFRIECAAEQLCFDGGQVSLSLRLQCPPLYRGGDTGTCFVLRLCGALHTACSGQ